MRPTRSRSLEPTSAGLLIAPARHDAIIQAVAASQPVLLLGERGSGRTSLLNHVAWRLAHQSEPRDTVIGQRRAGE